MKRTKHYFLVMTEGYESTENKLRMIVDVRDLTASLLMVFEKPEAEGRYICTSHLVRVKELVHKLRSIYPNYNYPKKYLLSSSLVHQFPECPVALFHQSYL